MLPGDVPPSGSARASISKTLNVFDSNRYILCPKRNLKLVTTAVELDPAGPSSTWSTSPLLGLFVSYASVLDFSVPFVAQIVRACGNSVDNQRPLIWGLSEPRFQHGDATASTTSAAVTSLLCFTLGMSKVLMTASIATRTTPQKLHSDPVA